MGDEFAVADGAALLASTDVAGYAAGVGSLADCAIWAKPKSRTNADNTPPPINPIRIRELCFRRDNLDAVAVATFGSKSGVDNAPSADVVPV